MNRAAFCLPAIAISLQLVAIMEVATLATAAAAPPTLVGTLHEQWRLADSDDSLLIGNLVDAAADAAGNTYLLDFDAQTVAVISPKGELLRTLGRPGDGPGETRMASRMFVEPDGRVGLLDAMSSRLVWFDAAGSPEAGAGHLRLNPDGSGATLTYDARRCAGGYVAAFAVLDVKAGARAFDVALARVPDDGSAAAIIHRVPDRAMSARGPLADEADSYNFVYNAWDADRAGNVFLAPDRDRPRVVVLPAGGGAPSEFPLVTGRRDRTAAEKAAVAARLARPNGAPAPRIADAEAFVGHLWCDEQGRVWVRTPSPDPPVAWGVFLAYDVYSASGAHLERVELRGPDDPRRDAWFLLPGRRVIVVRNANDSESDEGPEVVGYAY